MIENSNYKHNNNNDSDGSGGNSSKINNDDDDDHDSDTNETTVLLLRSHCLISVNPSCVHLLILIEFICQKISSIFRNI